MLDICTLTERPFDWLALVVGLTISPALCGALYLALTYRKPARRYPDDPMQMDGDKL